MANKTVDGYYKLGARYVSKAFLAAAAAAVLAGGVLYSTILHPAAMRMWYSRQLLPEFRIDSPYLADYSGRARLLNGHGEVVYEGEIDCLIVSGSGKLFQNGTLLYEGDFIDGQYNGSGILYDAGGAVLYSGGFEAGLYSGYGLLRYTNGGDDMQFEGYFDHGLKSGSGQLYRNGALLYDGSFARDEYDGFGALYGGTSVYRGGFVRGAFEGAGRLSDGDLLYDGTFAAGQFDGEGKLYRNGSLVYRGGFTEGRYSGDGSEFNPITGHLIFSGKYLDGVRMQAGTEFDENGEPVIIPIARLDPLSLLGAPYKDVLTALIRDGAAYREQSLESIHLVIDDAGGVLYSFPLADEPAELTAVYLCGLTAVGGYVVGSDIDGTQPAAVQIGARELFALELSNTIWGRETPSSSLTSRVIWRGGMRIAVFHTPSTVEEETETRTAGRIVFLRVEC